MSEKRKPIMANKTNKLFISTSLLAFIFTVILAQYTSAISEYTQREPASQSPYQLKKFDPDHHQHVHKKIKPPIQVLIDKDNLGKIYANDEFEITATIISSIDTSNVEVEWDLPQFVKIIAGETMHSFSELKANERKVVRLSLKSFSEENQQIHVKVSAPFGKNILSAVDQFNTTLESDLRQAKADLLKRSQEYKRQHSHK